MIRITLGARLTFFLLITCLTVCAAARSQTGQASLPVEAGYQDFSYGSVGMPAPTEDKPQSKLWFNNGIWWGVLYNATVAAMRFSS